MCNRIIIVDSQTLKKYPWGVTPGELLQKLGAGDASSLDELVTAVYGELHRIAARHLSLERAAHTLQATALVHEAYLKLGGNTHLSHGRPGFNDRAHFLAVASRVMRQILVDYARGRAAKKRSSDGHGNSLQADWTTNLELAGHAGGQQVGQQVEILDLDAALGALAHEDECLEQLIVMRYFGGMTAEEIAGVLGQSVHIVRHDLRLAQSWLRRKLSPR